MDAIYLFLTSRRLFPRFLITMLLLPWVVFLVTVFTGYVVAPWLEIWDLQSTDAMIQDDLFAAAWIPYVLHSPRVAATFVRPLRRPSRSLDRTRGTGPATEASPR